MGKNQHVLTTERLILRPWAEDDAQSLYKYAKHPAIGPIAGWPPHTSIENSREIIRTVFAAPETYAVVLKETEEPVGSIGIMFGDGLHSADMQPNEAEIGYWIGVPYWGRGLTPEAVRRLLRRCFEDLGLKAVWCGYYDGNLQSKRVMEKCGFRFHHTETGKTSPLGDVRTEHFMQLTKQEWKAGGTYIAPVISQKKRYLPLLLLGDEQESAIDQYLERGDMFVMKNNEEDTIATAVVTDEGDGVMELKNLAVAPCHQRKGYGRKMIEYLCNHYKGRCHTLLAGTGESNRTIAFYENCGFGYSHRVANFFTQNYDHLIVEDGQILKDMVYFARKLEKGS